MNPSWYDNFMEAREAEKTMDWLKKESSYSNRIPLEQEQKQAEQFADTFEKVLSMLEGLNRRIQNSGK